MPSAVLLQAIHRLDRAVTQAESAYEHHLAARHSAEDKRRADVQAAIQELDTLISGLRGPENGEAEHG